MRLILLHGWGASGADLLPVGEALGQLLGPLVLRPLEAPDPHPAGAGARQWYDLNQPGWPQRPAAVRALGERLDQELAAAGAEPVVVLGFSQGAAMALEAALARPVAAVIAFRRDPVVPITAQAEIRRLVEAGGGEVQLEIFDGEHTIPPEALLAAANFLRGLGLRT
ncbi:MAG: esterase [Synechococcaceae bacterium WB6_3B_236]|nr:esterase [Synechococcaceae bacterium WB6_3B_236]